MPPRGKQTGLPTSSKDSSSTAEAVRPTSTENPNDDDIDHDDQDLIPRLAATNQRIQQLEELAALQTRVRELETLTSRDKTHRRPRRDSDSSGSQDLKVDNIITLITSSTFRQRDDWLSDLQRAFKGAPRKFKKDTKKIFLALNYMDLESRTRWGRYLAEQTEEMQQSLSDDWNAFSEWTLSLIKEAGQMETYLTQ